MLQGWGYMHNNLRHIVAPAFVLVILGMAVVFVLLWGIDAHIIKPTFQDLENRQAVEDADRVKAAIEYAGDNLGNLANDWANWDDTYVFAKDHNHRYIDTNYPKPELISIQSNVDLLAIFDQGGRSLMYGNYHPLLKKQIELSVFSGSEPAIMATLAPVFKHQKSVDGVLYTDQGLMLLAARPIFNSAGQGPSRGVLLMGRFLTETVLENIAGRVNVRFDLFTIDDDRLTIPEIAIRSRLLSAASNALSEFYQDSLYQAHADIDNRPVLLLRTRTRGDILEAGDKTRYFLKTVLLGISFFLLLCLAIYRARMKISQKSLLESKERYQRLFANNHTVMVVIDPETADIVDANPAASAYYGWTVEQLKRMKISEINTLPHDEILAKIQSAYTGTHSHFEFKHRKADGSIADVEVYSGPLNVQGKVLLYSIVHDITARKQAEEALRESSACLQAIMNRIDAMIYIADVKTHELLFVNEQGYKVYGRDIVGRECWKVLHDQERPCSFCTYDRLVEEGGRPAGVYRRESRNRINKRWYDIADHAIQWTDGRMVRMEIATDVTERKQAEEHRHDLERQLQKAQKVESLERMAGAVAHHYNNLLGMVLGNLELAMMQSAKVAGVTGYLEEGMSAACRAAEIGKQMLAYLGRTFARQTALDLAETCRRYLPRLRSGIPERILLLPSFPDPGPVINGNADQIRQILSNLVTNGWESMGDRSGGMLSLAIRQVFPAEIPAVHRFPEDFQPAAADYACLEVKDEGSGISEDEIEKIFDPFFSTRFTGRGLGLPVVIGIVKAHDGCVTVESERDHGSIFRVFLPVLTILLP